MKRPLPWRTIIPSRDTGRFTPEQLEQAVLSVMRQAETVRAGRPMIVGERGPAYGSPRPADPATAPEPARGGPPMVMRDQGPAYGSPRPAEAATPGSENPDESVPATAGGTSAQRRRTRRKGAAGEG